MSLVKQEYLNKTYRTLMASEAQRRRLTSTNYTLDNKPVDAKQLQDVPRGKVILNEKVFEELQYVNDESEKAGAEFSYILTGITEGQTIKFDNIAWCRNQGNNVTADFSPLVGNLNAFVKSVQQMGIQNTIICNGHTHPKQLSRYAEDFSVYDMAGFMQMKEENAVFKNGTIDLCGGIMSDLNFNFCFYDDRMQDFYKFNDVVLELETGEQIPLSCYDRKVSRSQIAEKILKSVEVKKEDSFRNRLRQGTPTLSEQSDISRNAQRRLAFLRDSGHRQENSNERTE